MAGRECYHCKQWIEEIKSHDCWTTTEEKLTQGLPEDLLEAWFRIRETATDFGEQRIYASHKSIMFSRKACYFFVRPQKKFLEVCFFVGRTIKHPVIRKTQATTKTKVSHLLRVMHRDEVETPITDWLREAYEYSMAPKPTPKAKPRSQPKPRTKKKIKAKPKPKTKKKARLK
jgi:hypothetical protein